MLKAEIHYRAKAIAGAFGVLFTAAATWLVTDPGASAALQHLLPEPFQPFVPVAIGVGSVVLVHSVGTAAVPATMDDWQQQLDRAVDVATRRLEDVLTARVAALQSQLPAAPGPATVPPTEGKRDDPAPASPAPIPLAAAVAAAVASKQQAPAAVPADRPAPVRSAPAATSVIRLDPPPGL